MKDRCQAEGVHPLKHRLLGFRSEIVRPHVGMLRLETNGDIIKTKVIIITTRGQGELRFSRLNVCIAFLDRYSSYGSYKAPLIQREFEFELNQFT